MNFDTVTSALLFSMIGAAISVATIIAFAIFSPRPDPPAEISDSTRWLSEHAQATIESATRTRGLLEAELADRMASESTLKELERKISKLDLTVGHLAGKIMLSDLARRTPQIGEEMPTTTPAERRARRVPQMPGLETATMFPPPPGFPIDEDSKDNHSSDAASAHSS